MKFKSIIVIDGCLIEDSTPFNSHDAFYKQGISSVGTQRYQCKTCKKKTTLTPTRDKKTGYRQKRNDILPTFTKLIINKTPVSRTIDVLGIGTKTYYSKLL